VLPFTSVTVHITLVTPDGNCAPFNVFVELKLLITDATPQLSSVKTGLSELSGTV